MSDCIRPTKTNNSFILRIPLGGSVTNIQQHQQLCPATCLFLFVHRVNFQIGKRVISRLADIFLPHLHGVTVEPLLIGFGIWNAFVIVAVGHNSSPVRVFRIV